MPTYRYRCPANGRTVEVVHRMTEDIRTWGELVARAETSLGSTPADAPVERVLFAPHLAKSRAPSDAELASKGFTKLVRREKGVYENVTARSGQPRMVHAED